MIWYEDFEGNKISHYECTQSDCHLCPYLSVQRIWWCRFLWRRIVCSVMMNLSHIWWNWNGSVKHSYSVLGHNQPVANLTMYLMAISIPWAVICIQVWSLSMFFKSNDQSWSCRQKEKNSRLITNFPSHESLTSGRGGGKYMSLWDTISRLWPRSNLWNSTLAMIDNLTSTFN